MPARGLRSALVMAALLGALATAAASVPPGYRYVGSRVVSLGRVVYWYWNVDHVEIGPLGDSFVARLYARAVEVNQERPFVAVVRCDSRTYRALDARDYETIEDGEPIAAVWRAGCDQGRAVDVAHRHARLNAGTMPPAAVAGAANSPPPPVAAQPARTGPTPSPTASSSPPTGTAKAGDRAPAMQNPPPPPAAPARGAHADPRRADACVRFAEARGATAGDAMITNTCKYPVEVTLCYKGGRDGLYDCPSPPRGRLGDSLAPGTAHVLPEYRRGRHTGITAVACRGTPGTVFPRLDEGAGTTGCH